MLASLTVASPASTNDPNAQTAASRTDASPSVKRPEAPLITPLSPYPAPKSQPPLTPSSKFCGENGGVLAGVLLKCGEKDEDRVGFRVSLESNDDTDVRDTQTTAVLAQTVHRKGIVSFFLSVGFGS